MLILRTGNFPFLASLRCDTLYQFNSSVEMFILPCFLCVRACVCVLNVHENPFQTLSLQPASFDSLQAVVQLFCSFWCSQERTDTQTHRHTHPCLYSWKLFLLLLVLLIFFLPLFFVTVWLHLYKNIQFWGTSSVDTHIGNCAHWPT